MIKIPFFKAFCWRCFRNVHVPLVSDFSYGELLFQTQNGKLFAHVSLIDNPFFEAILTEIEQSGETKSDPQEVLARLADPIENQSLQAGPYRCPRCNRRLLSVNDNRHDSFGFVPEATWAAFNRLSVQEQKGAIQQAIMAG